MNKFVPLRRHQRERGVTAIEFAILFPVFFSILYAIIQYGMIFAAQQTLTLAAEEGARAALQYQAYTYASPCGTSATTTAVTWAGDAMAARQCVAQNTCQGLVGWVSQLTGLSASSICTTNLLYTATSPVTGLSVTGGTATCSVNSMDCVTVTASFQYGGNPATAHPLVPTLPLLGWTVPGTLSNTATVQIDPANVI